MPPVSEHDADIADLRQRKAKREQARLHFTDIPKDEDPVTKDPIHDAPQPEAPDAQAEAPPDWAKLLESLGVNTTDAKELLDQFSHELGDLTKDKPLTSMAAAFGLGFVLGRMSK